MTDSLVVSPTRSTQTYPIVETFHSLQGEGAWMGVSAFFIRLAGCDVHCPWCDTKESWPTQGHPQQSITELTQIAQEANPAMVVITGGEPLMHNLFPLTAELKQAGLRVHLETSGAHPVTGNWDWVTFSPKRYKSPHKSIYERVDELKVVVAEADDLEWAKTEADQVPLTAIKYLQPEWNTPHSQQLVFEYVLRHPDWRVSLQTHKLMGVR
ncbi:7-carboxy-7-deazaguanine synthase QueE [Spirulina sp. CS-785/01]|uniref:7-carboxy-7-deazaguanine synthase QueE n=1 Tax=Spirulina sp. CS-785/01 TaxID=3021716 RepID=UPI00232ABB2E|nr:7-carboxy-7-deazaguanine synthase QueE [Spirulina sp. CS-785/01]MDB9315931.1 7-carboxy-7-deazaguanine synthase QueE [Spirulina sp. CS-785/01]